MLVLFARRRRGIRIVKEYTIGITRTTYGHKMSWYSQKQDTGAHTVELCVILELILACCRLRMTMVGPIVLQ